MGASTDADVRRVARWLMPWLLNAHQLANATAQFLKRFPIPKAEPLPESFLFEVSGYVRLCEWEIAGIRELIDPDLPTPKTAWADLLSRLQAGNVEAMRQTPLLKAVMHAWATRCARESRLELGVDIVLDAPDLTVLLNELAKLLWKNLHLSHREEAHA